VRSCVALALMLALLVATADAQAQVGARAAPAPAAGDLFVLTAAGGKIERVRGRNRVFRLVLRRPDSDVTGFTDRPTRGTGQQPLAGFVRSWQRLGFGEDPPNAAVVLANAPSNRDVLVVELSRPRLGAGGRTLAFRAVVLRGNPTGGLRSFARRADRRLAARFGRASLFIDASGQEVGLVFGFSNIPAPSGFVSIEFLDSNGRPTAQVDLGADLFLNTDGANNFIAGSSGFTVTATGSSPLNGSAQVTVNVGAGEDCVSGRAFIPSGASAEVRVMETGRRFPVTTGQLCIPFD
jgi:hypothetical protein